MTERGELPVTNLLYRHPLTGHELHWTAPMPCAPRLLQLIEQALAKRGYVRVEDDAS